MRRRRRVAQLAGGGGGDVDRRGPHPPPLVSIHAELVQDRVQLVPQELLERGRINLAHAVRVPGKVVQRGIHPEADVPQPSFFFVGHDAGL